MLKLTGLVNKGLKLRRWSPKLQLWKRRLTLTSLVQIWRFGLQCALT